MSWTAHQALDYWVKEKKLTAKKADELKATLPEQSEEMRSKAIGIFTAVGAILIGLGVILFVASHWEELTPVLKIALLTVTMVVTGWAGYVLHYEKGYEKTGLGLLFLNILVFGASIFLVAQIYHLPLDFWWGALLWFLGTVFFGYVLRSRLHLWLSVPLLLLTLGWLRTSWVSAGEFDFIFGDRASLLPMLPAIGLGFIAKSFLSQRFPTMRFVAPTYFHWGLFLVLLLSVISTIDKTVLFQFARYPFDTFGIVVAAIAALMFLAALIWGRFQTGQGKAGAIALFLYVAFIAVLSNIPKWMGFFPTEYPVWLYDGTPPMILGLYVVHVLLVFALLLTVVWFGTLLHRAAVINMGMIGLAVTIFIQYFSWAFAMLDRSLAFILGGILILGLGTLLERQRRKLILSSAA